MLYDIMNTIKCRLELRVNEIFIDKTAVALGKDVEGRS